ncbi:unnamed protein product [Clonostachys byssicola]|uniref:DOMON domain-containing protein n=1 Tax=Clonostachys byssicola TaxID=160290 RepID=A0A9N9UND0_9HYPO|nr:unnamed protein product [Clonostachys byssicola]
MLLSRYIHAGISASLSALPLLMFPLGMPVMVNAASSDTSWIPFDLAQFNGNATLDTKGDVQLFWKTGDEYSTYGIASRSKGYLALGFSETGAMTGADIAVGSMDNGEFKFENRFAAGFVSPEVSKDQQNNMRLKEGHQQDGVTAFVFEKKNVADCLAEQVNVNTESWQWFIYAFSDENTFAQHKAGNKGKSYVKLGTGETISVNEIRPVDNAKNFTLTQSEVAIPTQETTYCYTMHKMPSGKKNYILGERPERSSDFLHHLVLYACYGITDQDKEMVGKDAVCSDDFSNPCNGFVTEWSPGMSGRTFEPGYGKPFGEDYYEYVMLETHYNNPDLIDGQKDAASFSFIYTDQPVKTEVGSLTLGDVGNRFTLEPGKELVAVSRVCTPECTGNWPEEGITAFSVFHHMHYRGRNARVQIIRDGKEIAPLSELRHFDYGYQFSKGLNQIKLLPGDMLITTCEFETTGDTEPVKGGLSSQQEMCFSWVDYYPANTIMMCSQFDMGNSTKDGLTGVVGFCSDSTKPEAERFESASITNPFEALPETGNTCNASNSTGTDSSDNAADDSAASSSLPSLTLLITMLSTLGFYLAFNDY